MIVYGRGLAIYSNIFHWRNFDLQIFGNGIGIAKLLAMSLLLPTQRLYVGSYLQVCLMDNPITFLYLAFETSFPFVRRWLLPFIGGDYLNFQFIGDVNYDFQVFGNDYLIANTKA